jgi:hypothetical protein
MADMTLIPGSLTCPECQIAGEHYQAKDNRVLGLHRRTSHGIAGAHHKGAKPARRKGQRTNGIEEKAAEWLRTHPGTHRAPEMAVAWGIDPSNDRVVKILSSAKRHGHLVTSDGNGNWYHTGPAPRNLPAKAPERPPEPAEANGKVHFVSQQIVLLLTDTEGREWVAEPR